MTSIMFVAALALAVVLLVLYATIKKLLWVSTPNEVLIFSGSTRKVGDRTLGYRFVRGGRSMRKPLVERVDVMDLSMFTVMVHVQGAFSKGGIPLTIQGVANVKLPGEEPLLSNAVERFLGRTREEIYHIAKETLEGNLRGVLASLTPEEVNEDKLRFAQTLLQEAEHDMSRVGLVLDTLKVQNVTDDVQYLSSIGRARGAGLNKEQASATPCGAGTRWRVAMGLFELGFRGVAGRRRLGWALDRVGAGSGRQRVHARLVDARSMRVEQLRLHRLAEPSADGAALEVRRSSGRGEGRRLGRLAEPREKALDGGAGHDEGAKLQPAAAVLTVLDIDFETTLQKLTPRAITTAMRGRVALLRVARRRGGHAKRGELGVAQLRRQRGRRGSQELGILPAWRRSETRTSS